MALDPARAAAGKLAAGCQEEKGAAVDGKVMPRLCAPGEAAERPWREPQRTELAQPNGTAPRCWKKQRRRGIAGGGERRGRRCCFTRGAVALLALGRRRGAAGRSPS